MHVTINCQNLLLNINDDFHHLRKINLPRIPKLN